MGFSIFIHSLLLYTFITLNCSAEEVPSNLRQRRRKEQSRIVGGQPVGYALDYQVLIERDGLFACGGVLVAQDVVLTAAHCQARSVSSYDVYIGLYNRLDIEEGKDYDFVKRKVSRQKEHPNYNAQLLDNDLLLLHLDGAVPMAYKPIALLTSDTFPPTTAGLNAGDVLMVSGWGTTAYGGIPSEVLLSAEVNYVPNAECNEMYEEALEDSPSINDWELCASSPGKDACQGDSGGPLVWTYEGESTSLLLVGIVSWGFECALPEFPGVYARVSYFYDWIRITICETFLSTDDQFCNNAYNDIVSSNSRVPSFSPSVSSIPTESVSPTVACTDYHNYFDAFGDGCDFYEQNEEAGCPKWGNISVNPNANSPQDACCHCYGGVNENINCEDYENFQDAAGDSCEWYAVYDDYLCPVWGNYGEDDSGATFLLTAETACCHCGGGTLISPTNSPSRYVSSTPTERKRKRRKKKKKKKTKEKGETNNL